MRWASPPESVFVGRSSGQVAQADVVHEPEPLPDLGDDVARHEASPLVEVQGLEARYEIRGRPGEERGEGKRGAPSPEVELDGAGHPVEPLAAAVRAGLPCGAALVRIEAELAQAPRVLVADVVLGLLHPGVDPPVSPAGGAPAPRRVEREILGVELGEGLPGLDVGAGRREPRQDPALLGQEEARALADAKRPVERLAVPCVAPEVGDHDLDVVLLVAVELLEGVDPP